MTGPWLPGMMIHWHVSLTSVALGVVEGEGGIPPCPKNMWLLLLDHLHHPCWVTPLLLPLASLRLLSWRSALRWTRPGNKEG